ncbi:Tetratricopeptide repeat protein 36-like protein [Aphelenchoides bicaudatus]|nr:Tetratricopeptide repeat protein 36-like protein [Aphelenchoides bicaudatus]
MATQRDKDVLNIILNPLMPNANFDESKKEESKEDYSHLKDYEQSHQLEIEGIRLSEERKHEEAIAKFDQAIEVCPQNPSAYNNRAQQRQLLKQLDEAKQDLEKAVELSGGKGKSACQAFAQRGLVYRLEGKMDLAKEDYQKAADLGSKFAKMELVTLNPYAAMCNQMLFDVMEKLRNGDE